MDEKWELKRDLIKVGRRLGVGNYGEVFMATINDMPVAVKSIKEDSMEMEDFMKEAHVMKKLQYEPLWSPLVQPNIRTTSQPIPILCYVS